jgi:putative GTP pyrophosphokinase
MPEKNAVEDNEFKRDPNSWYSARFDQYTSFTRLLHATIENLMRASAIDFLSVSSRTKSIVSFVEKVNRKGYESEREITDLSGVRVISFIESDAKLAADLLRASFTVYPEKSLDKSEELGDSQVGYRSIHLICELRGDRASLPEYKPFQGLLFEIQVRTVLQHAWAEIDHDRGYKFSGVLPSKLRRRLNLLAGQLEMADAEFSRLASDVESHAEEAERKRKAGDLDIELSSSSLGNFLESEVEKDLHGSVKKSEATKFAAVIDELDGFGVKTIEGVRGLLSARFLDDFKKVKGQTTQVGLLRKAMMYADIDRYFSQAWHNNWTIMANSSNTLLRKKWGDEKVQSIQGMMLRETEKQDI